MKKRNSIQLCLLIKVKYSRIHLFAKSNQTFIEIRVFLYLIFTKMLAKKATHSKWVILFDSESYSFKLLKWMMLTERNAQNKLPTFKRTKGFTLCNKNGIKKVFANSVFVSKLLQRIH